MVRIVTGTGVGCFREKGRRDAEILLRCDQGRFQDRTLTHQAIADVLLVSLQKINRVKRRFVERGLEAALDKRTPERNAPPGGKPAVASRRN